MFSMASSASFTSVTCAQGKPTLIYEHSSHPVHRPSHLGRDCVESVNFNVYTIFEIVLRGRQRKTEVGQHTHKKKPQKVGKTWLKGTKPSITRVVEDGKETLAKVFGILTRHPKYGKVRSGRSFLPRWCSSSSATPVISSSPLNLYTCLLGAFSLVTWAHRSQECVHL